MASYVEFFSLDSAVMPAFRNAIFLSWYVIEKPEDLFGAVCI
jgi:hypothetical protein